MRRIKASVTALIIAVILFIYVYKPAEHEQHAESPTESSQMIPPMYDVAPLAPPPKPIKPPVAKAEVKAESKPVAKTVNKPTAKAKEKKQINREESSQSWQTFEASYYTSSCHSCSGITKSGYSVRDTIHYRGMRVIATDPNVLPLGTVVEIATHYGSFKAVSLDTGGRIKSKSVDILVKTKEEAYRLGRHSIKLRVVGKIDGI